MIYFGSKISPNLTRTDEGFLIALNVPIARTGMQKYLPAEVPVENPEQYAGPDGLIPVYREPEEVFSDKTIASFEGKPIADNHPSTPDNKIHAEDIGLYGKGHMQNVRHGPFNELLADLVITDIPLSNVVESGGKREISCGYDCDWVVEDGKVYQKNITGNHVAVVPKGRAGSTIAIKDAKPEAQKTNERGINLASKNFFKHALGLGLKEAIKDAEPEEVAELMDGHEKTEKPAAAPAKDAEGAPGEEGGPLEQILAAIKDLSGRVAALESSKHTEPEKSALDALNEETKEDKEESHKEPDGDESDTIDSSEGATDCNGAKSSTGDSGAAVKDFIRQLKPQIAKIADKATRDSMAQACLDMLHGSTAKPKDNVYANINKAAQTHTAPAAQDSKPMTIAEKNAAFVANLQKAADAADKMGG